MAKLLKKLEHIVTSNRNRTVAIGNNFLEIASRSESPLCIINKAEIKHFLDHFTISSRHPNDYLPTVNKQIRNCSKPYVIYSESWTFLQCYKFLRKKIAESIMSKTERRVLDTSDINKCIQDILRYIEINVYKNLPKIKSKYHVNRHFRCEDNREFHEIVILVKRIKIYSKGHRFGR